MTLSGYPGSRGGEQWRSLGTLKKVNGAYAMDYDIVAEPGYSGSPVYDSARSVYCIVSAMYPKPLFGNPTYNGRGTRMYVSLFNLIVQERSLSAQRWP